MLKSPYKIDAGAGFTEAAVEALGKQLDEMFDNLDGTLDGDVESLHDMRVASRRLRAAMSVFGSAFPAKDFVPLEKEAARVTDALGEVRDSDVQIEYMTALSQKVSMAERVGVDALIAHLTGERERHRKVLLKELDRLHRSSFRGDFHKMLGREEHRAEEDVDG